MRDHPYKSYRDIGRDLAAHIIANPEVCRDSTLLVALISDFAASNHDQVAPLRDLMRRPGFQTLLPLARSKRGALQRDALAEELKPIYSEYVTKGIIELLNEFLDLNDSTNSEPSKTEQTISDVNSPQATELSALSRTDSRTDSSTHFDEILGPRLIRVGLSMAILGVVALLVQSPALCNFFRLCAQETMSRPEPSQEQLDRAQKSALAVVTARNRDELEKALSRLDADLSTIDPDALNQDQLSTFEEIKKLATDSQLPNIRESAKQEDPQSPAPENQQNIASPQTRPSVPVTEIPANVSVPAAKPPQQKPVIQELAAPSPRLEQEPTRPSPPSPVNPPATKAETQEQKRYSLPQAWEDRRARRREIMNNYSVEEPE